MDEGRKEAADLGQEDSGRRIEAGLFLNGNSLGSPSLLCINNAETCNPGP